MYADIFGCISISESLLAKVQSWEWSLSFYDGSNDFESALADYDEKGD